MVAYSFKKEFVPAISSGFKCQTIRGNRRRHALPGERMQLYCGMRTRHCFKIIPDPVCRDVRPVILRVGPDATFDYVEIDMCRIDPWDIDRLGKLDGFDNGKQMAQFWFETYGVGEFTGVIIRWWPE